jgi:hypothetical protein
MNFSTGQLVLCINDKWDRDCVYPVKRGMIYTIHGFYKCPCGSDQLTLVEMPYVTSMICGCSRCTTRRRSYYSWRFTPLESSENSCSASFDKNQPVQQIGEPEYNDRYPDVSSMSKIMEFNL